MKDNSLENETIPKRIYRKFVDNINSGKLTAGERLPGDRQLAEKYGAGRSSMISALRLLQEDGYIERLPMRGTFVRKDVKKITSEVKIFCPLPELDMSPENIGYANFIVNTEITQGLISNASEENCTITSRYMKESNSPLELRRELEIIQRTSDAVVFIGHQFIHLKELVFQNNIPALVIFPQYLWGQSHLPSISYDREAAFIQFAERLYRDGCKYLGIVSMHSPYEAVRGDLELRQSMLREQLAKKNIRVKDYILTYSEQPSESIYQELDSIFAHETELPDTFCGPHYSTIMILQQIKYQQNRKFNIVALTGGSIFSLIYPPITYIRIPCLEMGSLARKILIKAVKSGEASFADQTINAGIWPKK